MDINKLVLPVPAGLAINTNHPNVASIVVNQESMSPKLRRSTRQSQPRSTPVNHNVHPKNIPRTKQAQVNTVPTVSPRKRKRSSEPSTMCPEPQNFGGQDNTANLQPAEEIVNSVGTSKQAAGFSVSLKSSASIKPIISNLSSQKLTAARQAIHQSILKNKHSVPVQYPLVKKLIRINVSADLPEIEGPKFYTHHSAQCTSNGKKPTKTRTIPRKLVNSIATTTSQSTKRTFSQTTSTRTSSRYATAQKTPKRLALEAHLRTYEAYGTVRFRSIDPVAPTNSKWHLERIEGMFANERLMVHLEATYETRKKRQDSEKRLWELGKSQRWVLDTFKTFEEYESWLEKKSPKRREQEAESCDTETETGKHTDDTTEEELSDEEADIGRQAEQEDDGATKLIQLYGLDNDSKRSDGRAVDEMVAAKALIELFYAPATSSLSVLADSCCMDSGLRR